MQKWLCQIEHYLRCIGNIFFTLLKFGILSLDKNMLHFIINDEVFIIKYFEKRR